MLLGLYIIYRKNRYQLGFWGKVYKLTLVARLIESKKIYETTTVTKNGKQKTKVTYYPRIYMKFGGSDFKLYLPLDCNKFQK
ncbi:hypothetical protein JOC36_000916 [Weissella uvarum]|uniref:hypothetical protein n=1 Tax=Weissella uvarum TaxID=1479233 RepID=UPI001961653C|nr:hypothetical protein [Weissella uvarum]MBM7617359.1 hypothetical protein [Weissella uvarum]MCM0595754.1 hypothetical protein [Weissella uvarum]